MIILHAFVEQQLYNVDVRGAAFGRRAYYERSDVGQSGAGGAADAAVSRVSSSLSGRGSAGFGKKKRGFLRLIEYHIYFQVCLPLHGIAPHHTWVPVLWYQTGVESARLSPLMK